jgi:hypothetical protein
VSPVAQKGAEMFIVRCVRWSGRVEWAHKGQAAANVGQTRMKARALSRRSSMPENKSPAA